MVKVWFPSMFMRLVNHNLAKQKATLQVPPSMTKHEVKEYLSKIYNIEATKVSTVNVAGDWKRLYGKRKTIAYRRRNYKLAFVSYGPEEAEAATEAAKAQN
eukprot:gene7503-5393_t